MSRCAELNVSVVQKPVTTRPGRAGRLALTLVCGLALMCRASLANAQTADSFDPGTNGTVYTLAMQPDGKVLVGGFFTTIGGGGTGTAVRPTIARVDATGSVEAFNAGSDGNVFAIAVQPDGKILMGGDFNNLGCCDPGGVLARSKIGRVSTTGSWDQTFNPGANGNVSAIVVQPDGKILVAGNFTMIGGGGTGTTARNHIARLNADGTLDNSFDPGANGNIFAMALQADGKILVGGTFTTLGGGGTGTTTRNNIGRLNANGSLDTGFAAAADGEVGTFAMQKDGKVLIGGEFTLVDDVARGHIARLNADGTLDAAFDPGANGVVASLAIQADGKILAGGQFTTLGGGGTGTSTRNRIARVNNDGSIDATFDPGANDRANALALQSDGSIIVAGDFTMLGGGGTGTSARAHLGRITNTDAAVQTVTVNAAGTTFTWTRTGSGPEVTDTTFEVSSDGTTYTLLGIGARITDGWQLTGQSLPVNQNLLVRARGYYASGYLSSSGSIVESVVSVLIPAPPAVTTNAATGIGVTVATLNGTANPNNLSTTGSFEYGTSTAYGTTTNAQILGAGQANVSIGGGAITGLTCATLYHFRATATNSNGTTPGSDATFTTLACPPIVTPLDPSNVTATSATLNSKVNPNNAATTARFEYGTTTGYGSQSPSQAVGGGSSDVTVSADVTGLSCNTLYHFRLTATNFSTGNGSDRTFTTASCAQPTVVSISPAFGPAAGGTAVTIVGSNFSNGATVTVGGTAATGVVVVNATTITATTAAHAAGLVDVKVANSGTPSATLTNAYSYSTGASPTVTAVAPGTGSASGGVSTTITGTNFLVGAHVSFDGVAATSVTLTSATSLTATTPAHAAGVVDVVVTNPDTHTGTLANGFTYTSDSSGGGGGNGGGGGGNDPAPAPPAPPAPAVLLAPVNLVSSVSGSTVALSWSAAGSGAAPTTYIIQAGSFSGGSDLAVMPTNNTATSFVASGVGAGTYYVRVLAGNADGTSAPSNEVVVVVGNGGSSQTGVPGAPGFLSVSASGSTASLAWGASGSGGAATSYLIEAGSAPGLNDLASFSTGTPSTSLSVGNVPAGTYYVRVRGQNAAGTGAPSNEATLVIGGSGLCTSPASAPAGLTAVTVGSTVTLSWSPSAGSPTSYVIQAGSSSGASDLAVIDTQSAATTLSATAGSGTYFVRVLGKNACGVSGPSNEVIVQVQ